MKSDAGPAKCKKLFLAIVLFAIVIFVTMYYAQLRHYERKGNYESIYAETRTGSWINTPEQKEFDSNFSVSSKAAFWPGPDDISDSYSPVDFDINGTDVIVYLHIQKTGGSGFGRHLTSNIKLEKECSIFENRKRRDCMRPNSDFETWIFSRYTTGWACGLHADWTELHECVADKLNEREVQKERRYFYITVLREPVKRYISEWKHVQRGATWKDVLFSCNGHRHKIPKCYPGLNWRGVSLAEFTSCPFNMASNRQTRMLADLRLVECYELWLNRGLNATDIHRLEDAMLASAKKNLQEMTFFGLLEKQQKLQRLFEYTFPFEFIDDLLQYNVTRISTFVPTDQELKTIKKLNHLDSELYEFASKLFEQRYRRIRT